MLPVVAIVGRPNVGKSTLFNRLIGQRVAIVHDESGVTRDRHYGESFWNGRTFNVIDTGGYVPDNPDVMLAGIREQVHIALEESDVILFLVDVEHGLIDLDTHVADILRKQKKPVIVVANKADNEERRWNSSSFYSLGFEDLFPVSSVSGMGTGELMDRLVELLPEDVPEEEGEYPKIAIIGRPNVGKSSFVNAVLQDERSIVTDIPGTTRDSINSLLEYQEKKYILVDTAGLRRKTRVKENIEFYSTIRTHRAIRESDVVVMVIDATQGLEAQDIRLLTEAEKFNKGIIIAINKWDLVEKETNTFKEFELAIKTRLQTLEYIPVVSISALNKTRIYKVIELADEVLAERNKKISTAQLNEFIRATLENRPLPFARGKPLKITYATQVKQNPPVFAFFMNNPQDLPPHYRRYIENQLREKYSFRGVPVTMVFKQK
ncbi:MAG: ribosome biogenesis GTPase Der [Balneolaceae bacterium]|nr:MAG: ribosome biogenesis GTPase Der [Balneolaceae bacterium]